MNCKIDPVLYDFFLTLKQTLGAEIVHRRKRILQTCIEIIFNNDLLPAPSGRLNSLRDAEKCGFWIICLAQDRGASRRCYNGITPLEHLFTGIYRALSLALQETNLC